MEHLKKHKEEFQKIIDKYHLSDEDKAEEIANFLTKNKQKEVSAKDFSNLFAMTEKESVIFLSWIQTGIKFKEDNLNKK